MSSRATRSSARIAAAAAAAAASSTDQPQEPVPPASSGRKRKAESARDRLPSNPSATQPIRKRRRPSQSRPDPELPPTSAPPSKAPKTQPVRPSRPPSSGVAVSAAKTQLSTTSSSLESPSPDMPDQQDGPRSSGLGSSSSGSRPEANAHSLGKLDKPPSERSSRPDKYPLNDITGTAGQTLATSNPQNGQASKTKPQPVGTQMDYNSVSSSDFEDAEDGDAGLSGDDNYNIDDDGLGNEEGEIEDEEMDDEEEEENEDEDRDDQGDQDDDDDDDEDNDDDEEEEDEFLRDRHYGSLFMSQYLRHTDFASELMQPGQVSMRKLVTDLTKSPLITPDALTVVSERLFDYDTVRNNSPSWVKDLCDVLITLIAEPDDTADPTLMFVACNCMYNLVETQIRSIPFLVNGGAIPILCGVLSRNQFMDVPELILKILRSFSQTYPSQIISEGGLSTSLILLDFLETPVQRVAISMVANCCKKLTQDSYSHILDIIPSLQATIEKRDATIVEQASLCIYQITNTFQNTPDKLEQLITEPLMREMVRICSPAYSSVLKAEFQSKLLRVLAVVSLRSPKRSVELIQMGVFGLIYRLLAGSELSSGPSSVLQKQDVSTVSQNVFQLSTEQICNVLSILFELIPMPTVSSPTFDTPSHEMISPEIFSSRYGKMDINFERERLLQSCEDEIRLFPAILPVLHEVYSSTVNVVIRRQTLAVYAKLLSFLPIENLQASLDQTAYSSFLASLFLENDSVVAVLALRLVEILTTREGLRSSAQLLRGGVFSAIKAVVESASTSNKSTSESPSRSAESFRRMSNEDDDEDLDDDEEEDNDDDDDEDYDDEYNNEPVDQVVETVENSMRLPAFLPYKETSIVVYNMKAQRLVVQDCQKILDLSSAYTKDTVKYLEEAQALLEKITDLQTTGNGDGFELFRQLSDFVNPNLPTALTSFELYHSGFIECLVSFLEKAKDSHDLRPYFVKAFNLRTADGNTLFRELVSKIQTLLNQSESFEVASLHAQNVSSSSAASCSDFLSKRLHMNLRSLTPELKKLDESVSMAGIATFSALNTFLVSRAKLMNPIQNALGPEGESTENSLQSNSEGRLTPSRGTDLASSLSALDGLPLSTSGEASNESSARSQNAGASGPATPARSGASTDGQGNPLVIVSSDWVNNPPRPQPKPLPVDFYFDFYFKGTKVRLTDTVLGCIVQDYRRSGHTISGVWADQHTFQYCQVPGKAPLAPNTVEGLDNFDQEESDEVLRESKTTFSLISALRTLRDIALKAHTILPEQFSSPHEFVKDITGLFINSKLTAKLSRQMKEALVLASGCTPTWALGLTRNYSFLFPFETRYLFLQSTSFGSPRLLTLWQRMNPGTRGSRSGFPLGSAGKQKVRISRKRIFESAIKVMELYGTMPQILDIEYFDEEGMGVGPTLEFYSSVSRQFSLKSLCLWRTGDSLSDSQYVSPREGLFPAPLSDQQASSSDGKRIIYLFQILGRFIARSMIDFRIVDFAFNPAFFQPNVGSAGPEEQFETLSMVDPTLAQSVKFLTKFVTAKREMKAEQGPITVDDVSLEDLAINFTLPGYGTDLVLNGSDVAVTIDNVEEYIALLLEFTVGGGIKRQVEAFRKGFSEIFAYSCLEPFTADELVSLFGCGEEDWSFGTLQSNIKPDHGFSSESPTFLNLLMMMSAFDESERRVFLQFITGSTKLPIGGFSALSPTFTVVRKPSDVPLTPDDCLPSVMTCANYLKLPDYSTAETLQKKMTLAMSEGREVFLLS